VIILLEILLAFTTKYTLNWVWQSIFYVGVILNVIVFYFLIQNKIWTAFIIKIIILISIIIYPSLLLHKLYKLRIESSNIIRFSNKYFTENGKYPKDLNEYKFQNLKLKEDIFYARIDNVYNISFNIGLKTTNHFYSSERGWIYYDD